MGRHHEIFYLVCMSQCSFLLFLNSIFIDFSIFDMKKLNFLNKNQRSVNLHFGVFLKMNRRIHSLSVQSPVQQKIHKEGDQDGTNCYSECYSSSSLL